MKIKLNGKDCESNADNIEELLKEQDIKAEFVAVELNKKILKKTDFKTEKLKDGDTVEVVIFVGGG